jgi:hypothetical protein
MPVDMTLTILSIVAPVFLLGTAGFGWSKAGYDYPTEFVTRMAMTLAVRCLIFTALMEAEIDPAALTSLSLAALAAYSAVIALSWALVALTGLERRAYVAPLAFGNTGNIGLPLALFAYGETGLSLAVVVFVVMGALDLHGWALAGRRGGPTHACPQRADALGDASWWPLFDAGLANSRMADSVDVADWANGDSVDADYSWRCNLAAIAGSAGSRDMAVGGQIGAGTGGRRDRRPLVRA